MSGGTGSPRVRRADVFMETWTGVVERLEKLYSRTSLVAGPDRDVSVLPVATVDFAEKSLQLKGQPLQLPYVAVAPGAWEPNTASYNASVMRKLGMKSLISKDRSTWAILSFVPVVVTFQVMVVTDDMLTLIRMVDRWMSNELWGFELTHEDYRIKVKITADKAFSVPPQAPSSGGADQFRQVTSLRVETYSGYVWYVPSIYAVDLELGITPQALSSYEAMGLVDTIAATRIINAPDHEPVV